ncbi:MAG: hypothetical protein K6F93_06315 [Lachnospiraceae bacterium]|nr:hypothetical protein [Lachnospiraceae bacterium]
MIIRNRFEAVGQSLIFAAGVIVALVFVSIMIMEFENSKKLSDAVSENMLELTSDIKDSGIMMYDGVKVTGADVLNFGKKYFYDTGSSRSFVMVVTTESGTTLEIEGKEDMRSLVRASALTDANEGAGVSNTSSVDPLSSYIGDVIRNENGMITSVIFTYV